tara:strand:+ start:274 stop:963 length:690 start_codon:yes stop_codon:yes gene_type:complete
MTSLVTDLISFLRERQARLDREAIASRFSEFTMTPIRTFADNLLLAESVREVKGCVVECGVWRGGMSAGIAATLGADRAYYLYDSFEGLPDPQEELDGQKAIAWTKATDSKDYFDNCSASPDFAERAMNLAGATHFRLIQGWFENTLPTQAPDEPIALLRIDGDWYDSTMVCLENLFEKVVPGGLIIMDDYLIWDGCSRALHDYLSRTHSTVRIQNLGRVGYIKKLPTS